MIAGLFVHDFIVKEFARCRYSRECLLNVPGSVWELAGTLYVKTDTPRLEPFR
jgi:hypothetical protein